MPAGGKGPVEIVPITGEPLETAGITVGELVGWRIWNIHERQSLLLSYSAGTIWLPSEPMEGQPGDHDGAGVWAFKDYGAAYHKAFNEHRGFAVGSVYLWGNIVEHKIGYRAEFAEVRSIDDAPTEHLRDALRARYGVGSAEDADSADNQD